MAFTQAMTAQAQSPEAVADLPEGWPGDQRGGRQPGRRDDEVSYSTG